MLKISEKLTINKYNLYITIIFNVFTFVVGGVGGLPFCATSQT